MSMMRRISSRAGRVLIIALCVLLYAFLVVQDGIYSFPVTAHQSSTLTDWLGFDFSAFVAFIFLAVGSFVYLYARNRIVAWLLFSCMFSVMITFATETASLRYIYIFLVVSSVSSSIAFSLFAVLLLHFPRNLLARFKFVKNGGRQRSLRGYFPLLMRLYVVALSILCPITVVADFYYPHPSHSLLAFIVSVYYLIVLIGIISTLSISYLLDSTPRQRQQQRIFVVGVLLGFVPLLILNVLPVILNLHQFYVNAEVSTVTVLFLPLSLGYTILRYQVLVFDRYVRRAVAWTTGIVGLFAVGYLVIMLVNVTLSADQASSVIMSVALVGVLAPSVWWGARFVTERLFFTEMLQYRRLIDSAEILTGEEFDIEQAAALLTTAALQAFQTQEICLYVLDDETGTFRLYPSLHESSEEDGTRRALAERLLAGIHSLPQTSQDPAWIGENEPIIQQLLTVKHPTLLHLITHAESQSRLSLSRYVVTSGPLDHTDPLLAPIWAGEKMIGILALGERTDHQQYAGPDLDAALYMAARFSPALETARLYARSRRNARILSALYSENVLSVQRFDAVEDIAGAYAEVAANAVKARAELWLYSPRTHELQRSACAGNGPLFSKETVLAAPSVKDWVSWFYHGNPIPVESPAGMPSFLLEASITYPLAWLPLQEGEQPQGVLVLTYPRPHFFAQEEQHVLEMFAHQCAVAIENVRITLALRRAYERQKELDQLKDQFIATASHELRTPLTAVQGYIELLADFGPTLDAPSQAEFLDKARRSCDELALLVSNIMDASLIETEIEHVRRIPVSVPEAIRAMLEMFEGNFTREQRSVLVQMPDELFAFADSVRLRQVLLNILTNALKFSNPGSSIEIAATEDNEQATIFIRDYGLGVPVSEQERLFERFTRLERDMNSPVRGAGLGLYISKRLVEAMRGRIWVESSGVEGEGSTFAFSLAKAMRARSEVSSQKITQQV